MSRVFHLNEAMNWTNGALNCFLASKNPDLGHIGAYVVGQVRLVRKHLEAAKSLPRPHLP